MSPVCVVTGRRPISFWDGPTKNPIAFFEERAHLKIKGILLARDKNPAMDFGVLLHQSSRIQNGDGQAAALCFSGLSKMPQPLSIFLSNFAPATGRFAKLSNILRFGLNG